MSWLDEFWADLLSEEPLRIMAAWVTLESEEQAAVLEHLRRMATEEGWVESQRDSARAALDVIDTEEDEN
jgi:predicted Fe-S protein YdhL (DUF1289 family)